MGKPLFLRWLDAIFNPMACLPPPPDSLVGVQEKADSLLKRLEALLQQKLRYALAGEKRSILRGQGLDFAELREYAPGDDIRKIDWNVFARTLSPHVREYHEEKQLTVWLVIDCTPSMHFGRAKTKLELAIELAGLLALMAERANHRLGAFLIQNQGTEIIPPRTGHGQVQHIMKALLEAVRLEENGVSPTSERESLQSDQHCHSATSDPLHAACAKLGHVVQKQATVFFLSDFLSASERWDLPLGQLSRQTQMIYLLLRDPVEMVLPRGLGLLPVQDPETGQLVQLDTNDADYRVAYETHAQTGLNHRLQRLKETGAAIVAQTDEAPLEILLRLLKASQTPLEKRPA